MTTGLATTFEILTASRNEATGSVLAASLGSKNSAIFDGTLMAIISRRNIAGHLAVLQRWHLLSPLQQEFLEEGRGRMSGALRNAILSEDDQLFANACQVIERFQEFDLISTLVTLAENQKSKHAKTATDLVLRLVKQLSEIALGTNRSKDRRDPHRLCRFILESLERSVERYRAHHRDELIEAYVILGGSMSAVLREILDEPHHPCYHTVINTLTNSQSSGVIETLMNYLESEQASLNILKVIGKRADLKFISRFLKLVGEGINPVVGKNLARIEAFTWLQPGARSMKNFSEQDQALCIKLVSASGVKSEDFLDLIESILKHGEPEARWAACDALSSIPGERGNHLVLKSIKDLHPKVQASATSQIRNRHVPNAMAILLKQIESPHEEVREATSAALSEFSFKSFLAGFEALHEDVRRTTGELVKKVDPKAPDGILSELREPSRKRRFRALEMAEVMGLVPELSAGIMLLLEDEDHLIRAAAADVLQFCPTSEVQDALRRATHDPSGSVQHAAKNSLENFDRQVASSTTGAMNDSEDQR